MSRMTLCSWLFLVLATLGHAQPAEKKGKVDPKNPGSDNALRQELLQMMKEDQDARMAIVDTSSPDAAAVRKITEIDRKNTARLKEIIEKHGWPGITLVGDEGANAAWLLVQHADKDRAFQKKCLALLEKAVKARDASPAQLAYLTDRVLVAEKKEQVYGTQFHTVDGKMEPYPIADEKNVDRRRKEVGLSSLAEYRKVLEEVYKPKKKSSRP